MGLFDRISSSIQRALRPPPPAIPLAPPPAQALRLFGRDVFQRAVTPPMALTAADRVAVPATAAGDFSQRRAQARQASDAALKAVDDLLRYDNGSPNVFGKAVDWLRGVVNGSHTQPGYREWAGDGMKPATAWPLSQLLGGALDNALLGGDAGRVGQLVGELDKYQQDGAYAPEITSVSGTHQQRYFDDNAWIGLDLVQAYRQTGDKKYLQKAEALAPFLESGLQPGGGILWRENDPSPSLNTCANAPAMQLFLALNKKTGNSRYLDDAKRCESALNGTLRRADGLYDDNVPANDPSQRSDPKWTFSYNQGAAIGANLQMADACTDPAEKQHYLDLAKQTADATMKKLAQEPDWLWSQSPGFNAVFFRNLMKLDAVAPDPRYRQALDGYVDRANQDARGGNGAYENGGIGRYDGDQPGGIRLLDQGGMAQILALQGMTADQLSQLA